MASLKFTSEECVLVFIENCFTVPEVTGKLHSEGCHQTKGHFKKKKKLKKSNK